MKVVWTLTVQENTLEVILSHNLGSNCINHKRNYLDNIGLSDKLFFE